MRGVDRYRSFAELPPPVPCAAKVADLLHAVVLLTAPLMARQGITIGMSVQPSDLHTVWDSQLVEQALLNLLKNATEALVATSSPVIQIGAIATEEGGVVMTVANNGPALDDDIENLFLPFFTNKPGNAGIGLSIVRQVMLSHSGAVTATNAPDGPCFTLIFPSSDFRSHTIENQEIPLEESEPHFGRRNLV